MFTEFFISKLFLNSIKKTKIFSFMLDCCQNLHSTKCWRFWHESYAKFLVYKDLISKKLRFWCPHQINLNKGWNHYIRFNDSLEKTGIFSLPNIHCHWIRRKNDLSQWPWFWTLNRKNINTLQFDINLLVSAFGGRIWKGENLEFFSLIYFS